MAILFMDPPQLGILFIYFSSLGTSSFYLLKDISAHFANNESLANIVFHIRSIYIIQKLGNKPKLSTLINL